MGWSALRVKVVGTLHEHTRSFNAYLKFTSAVGAFHLVRRSHFSEICLQHLIRGQDNIVLLQQLTWCFFSSIGTMVCSDSECPVFGEFFNLCTPLVKSNHWANDKSTSSSTASSFLSLPLQKKRLGNIDHLHFILPVGKAFTPELLFCNSLGQIRCGWRVFRSRRAVL